MGRAFSVATLMLALAGVATGCSSGAGATSHATVRTPARGRAIGPPRCASRAASEPALTAVPTALVNLPGQPDGVATSPDGRWSFASLQGAPGRISVGSDRSFAPALLRTIRLPGGAVSGLAVTHDGRLLLGATGRGLVVVSIARATAGDAPPALGLLAAPATGAAAGGGGAEVAVSPDDRFAFVSLEGAGVIAVFRLSSPGAGGSPPGRFVGTIPLGIAPLGLAVSPDGHRLYATSELARAHAAHPAGTLTVIDVRRAETDPGGSVLAAASVPCRPVRVAASPDGIVWVTARTGDELFGFSASELLSRPENALVAAVRVGPEPIGLGVVKGGRLVIVADSDLGSKRGASARLTVIDTAAALRGRTAAIGAVRAGLLPSEIATEPGGRTLLVNNSGSGQLEAVDATKIR